jgi:hypothetical protein
VWPRLREGTTERCAERSAESAPSTISPTSVIDCTERCGRDRRRRAGATADEVDDLLQALGVRQMREADMSHAYLLP